jgi:hypothetical protein
MIEFNPEPVMFPTDINSWLLSLAIIGYMFGIGICCRLMRQWPVPHENNKPDPGDWIVSLFWPMVCTVMVLRIVGYLPYQLTDRVIAWRSTRKQIPMAKVVQRDDKDS